MILLLTVHTLQIIMKLTPNINFVWFLVFKTCLATENRLGDCKAQFLEFFTEKINCEDFSVNLVCENGILQVRNLHSDDFTRDRRSTSRRDTRLRETRRSYYRKRKINTQKSASSSESDSSKQPYPRYVVHKL